MRAALRRFFRINQREELGETLLRQPLIEEGSTIPDTVGAFPPVISGAGVGLDLAESSARANLAGLETAQLLTEDGSAVVDVRSISLPEGAASGGSWSAVGELTEEELLSPLGVKKADRLPKRDSDEGELDSMTQEPYYDNKETSREAEYLFPQPKPLPVKTTPRKTFQTVIDQIDQAASKEASETLPTKPSTHKKKSRTMLKEIVAQALGEDGENVSDPVKEPKRIYVGQSSMTRYLQEEDELHSTVEETSKSSAVVVEEVSVNLDSGSSSEDESESRPLLRGSLTGVAAPVVRNQIPEDSPSVSASSGAPALNTAPLKSGSVRVKAGGWVGPDTFF